jgi:hypothetical protein
VQQIYRKFIKGTLGAKTYAFGKGEVTCKYIGVDSKTEKQLQIPNTRTTGNIKHGLTFGGRPHRNQKIALRVSIEIGRSVGNGRITHGMCESRIGIDDRHV